MSIALPPYEDWLRCGAEVVEEAMGLTPGALLRTYGAWTNVMSLPGLAHQLRKLRRLLPREAIFVNYSIK